MRREKALPIPVSRFGISHCIIDQRGSTHNSFSPRGIVHIEEMEEIITDMMVQRSLDRTVQVQTIADSFVDFIVRGMTLAQLEGLKWRP